MNLLALRALVRKDLIEFASDRRALIMAVIAPILLASFMALVLGGAGGGGSGPAHIAIRVVDQDDSDLSRQIVAGIDKDENLAPQSATLDQARDAVRRGQAVVAVLIPKDFGKQASKALFGPGDKPELLFLYDPTRQAELGMVRGILTQHVMQAVSASTFGGSVDSPALAEMEADVEQAADMPPGLRDALKTMFRELKQVRAEAAAAEKEEGKEKATTFGMNVPYEAREEAVTAGNQQARQAVYAHAFGGMAVQFILFAAIESGTALLLERQRGIWKRLRAAPLSRMVLLAARAISATLISLVVTCVVFGFGAIFFGIRIQGGPLGIVGFLAVATAFALTAATFGLLVAALGKTPQAARGVSILAVLVMVMLGGAWVPSQFFPAWVRSVTPIIPTRWAVDGFDAATVRANSVLEVLGPAAALVGFAVVFGALAVARFRWDAD
jgi:ABC-2 type transport system permease protein